MAADVLPVPTYRGYSRYFRGPWCMARGCDSGASEFGIACDWHWGALTEETQRAIRLELLRHHPRGGGARIYPEQIMTIRFHGNAEAEWAALRALEEADEAEMDSEDTER